MPWIPVLIGFGLGLAVGFLLAAMLSMAHDSDHQAEMDALRWRLDGERDRGE